jgi:excisionase family DNA binding protein
MPEINVKEVYTREEAEALLKISESTMGRLLRSGKIRATKIGGQYRILGAELLRQVLPSAGYHAIRNFYRSTREKLSALESDVDRVKNNVD